jgi:hypothetical protein
MKRHRRARRNPLNPWLSLLLPAVAGAAAGLVVQNVIDGNSTITPQAPLAGAAVGLLAGGLGELADKNKKQAMVGLLAGAAAGAGAYFLNTQALASTSSNAPAASQLPAASTTTTTTPTSTTTTTTPAATS